MQTKTCKACRTVNEDFAIVCRNCGARIGDPPPPGAGLGGGADQPATQPTPAPPPMPTAPVSTSGWGALPPPQAPVSGGVHPGVVPKKSNVGLMIGFGVVVVLIGAAVVYLLTSGGGGGLPEQLAGHPRSDSEIAKEIEDAMGSFDIMGMSIDVALYGETEPVAMFMRFDGLPDIATDVPSDVFFEQFAQGFAQQQGLGLTPDDAVRASANGADFICVDAPASAFGGGASFGGFGSPQGGSLCVFKGDAIGMVMLMDGTVASAAMPAVQQAYAEIA